MEVLTQRGRMLILAGLLILAPFKPFAEEIGEIKPISRSRALSLALSQHPRLKVFQNRRDMAVERVTQARSGFLPRIAFSERYSRTNTPMWAFGTKLNQETITQLDFDPDRLNHPDAIDNFLGTLSLQWSIYDSGRTWYGSQQAVEVAAVANLDLQRTRQQVIAATAIAYDGVLLALSHLQVIDQAISLAEASLRLVTQRFEAGFVVKSDLLRAQVRLMDLKQKRYTADSRVAVAGAALNAAMGEPMERRYRPTDELGMASVPSRSMAEWIGMALLQRPELQQLTKQETIAAKEIDKQQAAHLPSFGLFGNYDINSEGLDCDAGSYTVGAMMEVALFSGFRDVSRTREARAAVKAVRASRSDLVAGIEVETRQAFYETASAGERIGVAETAVSLAEENRRIVSDRYQNGLLTIVELMDAETALQEARNNRCQALYDYRVSYVRLQLAAGVNGEQ
ncbi:MAG: TolC family protein [Pseudomonadota bacterium]